MIVDANCQELEKEMVLKVFVFNRFNREKTNNSERCVPKCNTLHFMLFRCISMDLLDCLVLRHPHSSRDKQSDFTQRKTTWTWDRNSFLNSSLKILRIHQTVYVQLNMFKSKMGRFPLPPSQNGKCHWCIHPPILRLQAWSTLWDFLQVEETNSSGVGVDTTIPGDLLNYTFLVQKGGEWSVWYLEKCQQRSPGRSVVGVGQLETTSWHNIFATNMS